MRSSLSNVLSAALLLAAGVRAAPTVSASPLPSGSSQILDDDNFGPIPAESSYYSSDNSTSPPFPGNYTQPVFPTTNGTKGADDLLFQNLMGAEWAIYAFYQYGVETFNQSAFVAAGYPPQTYQRIIEIRDNEAGHARIFGEQISNASVKPALCQYQFGISSPTAYLAAHTIVEISSMAFLTGLILQAKLDSSKEALVAIAEVESRHEAWGLIDIWQTSPFAGPVDTVFPYANQILSTTKVFVVPGSCPAGNPDYPLPDQNLPALSYAEKSTTLLPGSPITFAFSNPANQPVFKASKSYYAVYFHGLLNITEPFDPKTNASTIPSEFEAKGLFLMVISDTPGAPTIDTVVAGPLVITEQPVEINSGVL
ncbi:hypothetical protein MMC28_000225 [Mycoblastus sanguinarius]|nr:hypothetical protein [Mycoblastus sanguinarius]